MNPVKFLEDIQKEYFINTYGESINYDEMYLNEHFIEFLQKEYHFQEKDKAKIFEAMQKMRSKHMISQYENPYYYKYFEQIISGIHKIKDEFMDCGEKEIPLFGTVEFDLFYAQIRCPDSSMPPIILFDSEIIQVAHDITNVLTKAFPIKMEGMNKVTFMMEPTEIHNRIKKDKWIEKRFTDIVFSIYFFHSVKMCDVWQPQDDFLYRSFSNALADAFLYFIVAHECAHYYLGHLEENVNKEVVNIGNISYENMVPEWEQEFDADYAGALLTIPVLLEKGYDINVILGGIYIALWMMNIMESIHFTDDKKLRTHPHAKDRLQHVKTQLQRIMQEDLKVLDVYDTLFSVLWERFTVIFKEIENRVLEENPKREIAYEQLKSILYACTEEDPNVSVHCLKEK